MSVASIKEEARQLVKQFPKDATWKNIHYQIYFRQAVEAGLEDLREGRVVPLAAAKRQFGLGEL